ncbi:MAG TPA: phenylacetic acid degradation protein PaaN [Kineosporiaceae bacterium]|nr:phenylacetic acid degradation protein PaaN [Kineosporiaceae bacterium]
MTPSRAGPDSEAVAATVERQRELLDRAVRAIHERTFFSAFPESPSPRVYGETAAEDGRRAFEALLHRRFDLGQPGTVAWVATERSPWGPQLGVEYPVPDVDQLLPALRAAIPAWRDAGPPARAALCAQMLARINAASFEIANAVMHTAGQPFVMAFQAGGPHAQDRALEAVAYAYEEQAHYPAEAVWEKPQGKRSPIRMAKTFTIVPRGVDLVIGCTTFPTWNSYPGIFAGLATGNAVLVKPHPRAVLPLAITVRIVRAVLAEHGFDQDLVCLAAEPGPDRGGGRLAADLAVRPEIGIVDFTGSSAFGDWLEAHARQAQVYTEKAGVNAVLIDSTADYPGMLANLAFSLSLYSGQMCTTPQNLLVPRGGIDTDRGHKTPDEVAEDLGHAIDALLGDDARAVELLGALVNDDVLGRLESAPSMGRVVVASRAVSSPVYPDARVRTPLIVRVDAPEDAPDDTGPEGGPAYAQECFGPVAFLVTTASTAGSIEVFRRTVGARGAITAAVYSTDAEVIKATREAALDVGVALSENLTEAVYVNQSAAFSDFHATGANAAANASLTDGNFVSGRFRVIQSRRHLPTPTAGRVSPAE